MRGATRPQGRPPLFQVMEEDYVRRAAVEDAARQLFYSEAVGAYKMARVSQLVGGRRGAPELRCFLKGPLHRLPPRGACLPDDTQQGARTLQALPNKPCLP